MAYLLLTVTDEELLAGEVVKVLFALLLLFGAGYNAYVSIRAPGRPWKLFRAGLALSLLLLVLPVARWTWIEGGMLFAPRYAVGTTTGFCEAFARGKAVAFEYEVAGRTYRNCDPYHPVPVDSIVVPGGMYYVRYSARFPDKGRIDFHRKVE